MLCCVLLFCSFQRTYIWMSCWGNAITGWGHDGIVCMLMGWWKTNQMLYTHRRNKKRKICWKADSHDDLKSISMSRIFLAHSHALCQSFTFSTRNSQSGEFIYRTARFWLVYIIRHNHPPDNIRVSEWVNVWKNE